MNTKLIDLYLDYLKKISVIPITNTAAFAAALVNTEPMLSKAHTRTNTTLAVRSSVVTIVSDNLDIGVQNP